MELYHYTRLMNFRQIAKSGQIKLSASDLVKPTDLHETKRGNRIVIEASTDDIHPVVWLTTNPDMTASSIGGSTLMDADGNMVSAEQLPPFVRTYKDEVRITIKKTDDMHKWSEWTEENGIEKSWLSRLKKRWTDWNDYYVVEREIPVSEFESISICGEEIPATVEDGKLILPEWLDTEDRSWSFTAIPTNLTGVMPLSCQVYGNHIDSWMYHLMLESKNDPKAKAELEEFKNMPLKKRAERIAQLMGSETFEVDESAIMVM